MSARINELREYTRALLMALAEHDKVSPAEVDQILRALLAHIRSSRPALLISTELDQ